MPIPPAPVDLGFVGDEASGWTRSLRGRDVNFRLLRTLEELSHAELVQQDVFQVTERDLLSNVSLLSVAETGGAVIAAYLSEHPRHPVGLLIGWGGFVNRPRIVSDLLAVKSQARNLGLGGELKRLQAALALDRGFEEIVWTVDPLRAANAHLNFTMLGAISRQYEIDRYGSSFATGLYGGLPSDRLHVVWQITSPEVIARLRGDFSVEKSADARSAVQFTSGMEGGAVLIPLPKDIDAIVTAGADEAVAWRMRLRASLTQAFAEGFAITGFESFSAIGVPAYVLTRPNRRP